MSEPGIAMSSRGTYNVVEFVVAVHDGVSVAWNVLAYEVNNLVIAFVGSAELLAGVFVLDFGLLGFDA